MPKPHVRANKSARGGSQTAEFVKALLRGSSVWLTLGSNTVQREICEGKAIAKMCKTQEHHRKMKTPNKHACDIYKWKQDKTIY